MSSLEVVEEGLEHLAAYGEIPIAFEVTCRLDTAILRHEGEIVVRPVLPTWVKNYDACEEDIPIELASRFDSTHWRILAVYQDGQRVGGVLMAWDAADFDMLEVRKDLAVIADIRVAPDAQGKGIGRLLIQTARNWSRSRGCTQLLVETQDVNVPACRFYKSVGFTPRYVIDKGYGPAWDEAKIVWHCDL